MPPEDITFDSLAAIVLDDVRRKALLAALASEQGTRLPLHNKVSEAAQRCHATGDELAAIARVLVAEADGERLLEEFVFHPLMPHQVLHDLLDAGLCISALGHRSGPPDLLEKLASSHRYSEAITTLALRYYSKEDTSDEEFAAFVQKYRDDWMLRYNLRQSPELSDHRRSIALSIIGEHAAS
jgi:hypothetical protein